MSVECWKGAVRRGYVQANNEKLTDLEADEEGEGQGDEEEAPGDPDQQAATQALSAYIVVWAEDQVARRKCQFQWTQLFCMAESSLPTLRPLPWETATRATPSTHIQAKLASCL